MPDELSASPIVTPETTYRKRRRARKRPSAIDAFRRNLRHHSAKILTLSLFLIVTGSLLAVGTVHVESIAVIAPIAIAVGVFASFVDDAPLSRRLPAIVLGLLGLYSLLQSLPLPPQFLTHLSPAARQTWEDAFRLSGLPTTRWASVSLDPGASRVEGLKWLAYAAVYLAGARLAKECGSKRGALVVVVAALIGGALSIAHGLAGLEAWLGLYKPIYAQPVWALAPLLNPNNFAGYLNIAVFSGIGLLVAREPPAPRWVLGFASAFLAALVFLSASRAGAAALVIGFGMAGTSYYYQQRHARSRGGFTFPIGLPLVGVVVAAIGLFVVGATDTIWRSLFDENIEKLRMLDYSRPLIRDHLWTGVGRGAFETAFPAYRSIPGNGIAQYAENFVVQWAAEWGVPVAFTALVTLGWFMRPWQFGFGRNAVSTGIYVGLAVLLIQNLVDLATEIASVGFVVALLLGTVTGGAEYFADKRAAERSKRKSQSPERLPTSRSRNLAIVFSAALCVGGVGASACVAATGRPDALEERWELARRVTEFTAESTSPSSVAALHRSVVEAMLRHPADPYVPLLGALLAPRGSKNALSWLNQALRRDPMGARPHLLLAETLNARGAKSQALFELRRTFELGPEMVNEVAERAVRWSKTTEELLRAVPSGKSGIALLNNIAQRIPTSPDTTTLRSEVLANSLERDPQNVATHAISADLLLASLDSKGVGCTDAARPACEEELRRHAAVVTKAADTSQIVVTLKAKLLARDGKYEEAERLLTEHCPRVPNPAQCHAERVLYAFKLGDGARLDDAIANYTASACRNPVECANAYTWLGDLEMQHKDLRAALARYERAAQENPSSAAWMRVANVAMAVNRLGRAETALAAARRLSDSKELSQVEAAAESMQRARLQQDLDQLRSTREP